MSPGQTEGEKKCNYIMQNQKPCNKKTHDNEHCVFHSKDIEGKKAEFNYNFEKEFKEQKTRKQDYDFTGFVFPGEISFEGITFEKKVYAINVQFVGKAKFGRTQFSEDVYFGGAKFFSNASFEEVQFYGKANFDRTKFTEEASFLEAQFHGGTSFWDTHFSGRTDFVSCKFHETADFRQTKFAENAAFGKAYFSGRSDFVSCKFRGLAEFNQTQFFGDAVFGGANFIKNVSFQGAQFVKETDFRQAKFFEEAVFEETKFSEKASFWEAKFSKRTDFRRSQFSSAVSFVSAQFSGETHFSQTKFYEIVNFDNVDFQKGKNFFMEETYFYDLSGLLELIEEDNKNRKKKENIKFRYSQKTEFLPDYFRLILGEDATSKYPIISRKIRDDMYLLDYQDSHPWKFRIWWLLANCGRNFWQWAVWSFSLAFIFAVIFFCLGKEQFYIDPKVPYNFFTMVYYSVVTFTTLGFGNVTPLTIWACIAVMLEVISGYIMLGGLISILANKLARRS